MRDGRQVVTSSYGWVWSGIRRSAASTTGQSMDIVTLVVPTIKAHC
jgi:hypothetical protein